MRDIVDGAREVGNQIGGERGRRINENCNKIGAMTDKLAELRAQ